MIIGQQLERWVEPCEVMHFVKSIMSGTRNVDEHWDGSKSLKWQHRQQCGEEHIRHTCIHRSEHRTLSIMLQNTGEATFAVLCAALVATVQEGTLCKKKCSGDLPEYCLNRKTLIMERYWTGWASLPWDEEGWVRCDLMVTFVWLREVEMRSNSFPRDGGVKN